jgi:hypothetical protein
MELHPVGIDLGKTVVHLVCLNLRGEGGAIWMQRYLRFWKMPRQGCRAQCACFWSN